MKPVCLFKALREREKKKTIAVQSHQRVKSQIYNLTIVREHLSAKSMICSNKRLQHLLQLCLVLFYYCMSVIFHWFCSLKGIMKHWFSRCLII